MKIYKISDSLNTFYPVKVYCSTSDFERLKSANSTEVGEGEFLSEEWWKSCVAKSAGFPIRSDFSFKPIVY